MRPKCSKRPSNRTIDLDSSRYATYTWNDNWVVLREPFFVGGAPFPGRDRVVTKKEIVRTISEEIGLTQLKTKEIVQKTFDAIVKTLVEDRRIELRNFGVFEVRRRAPRKARNPRTNRRVFVPEKYVVTFKPGKEMEKRVRELGRREAARSQASDATPSSAAETLGASTTYDPNTGDS